VDAWYHALPGHPVERPDAAGRPPGHAARALRDRRLSHGPAGPGRSTITCSPARTSSSGPAPTIPAWRRRSARSPAWAPTPPAPGLDRLALLHVLQGEELGLHTRWLELARFDPASSGPHPTASLPFAFVTHELPTTELETRRPGTPARQDQPGLEHRQVEPGPVGPPLRPSPGVRIGRRADHQGTKPPSMKLGAPLRPDARYEPQGTGRSGGPTGPGSTCRCSRPVDLGEQVSQGPSSPAPWSAARASRTQRARRRRGGGPSWPGRTAPTFQPPGV